MTKPVRVALFSLMATTALAPAARADDACAADRARLCGDAQGMRAIMGCMKAHEAELSDACKSQRATVKEAVEEVIADCKADADRLCQGIPAGRGRLHACLTSHTADLSPACSQAIANAKQLRGAIHPGCSPDVEKFCQGIQHGGGRIWACLRSHEADLTPACKAHVDKAAARMGADGAAAK